MSALEPASTPPLPTLPVDQRPTADPYQVYLDSLDSAESRRTMRGVLDRIARMQTGDPNATGAWQPWWLLRYEHTMAIRAALTAPEKRYSPDHINKHLNGVRRVLYTSWMLQLMSAEDYQRAASIKNVKSERLPAGRNIRRDELAAMLSIWEPAAIEGDPAALRNTALVAALYSTGMRRFEAAAARIEHYDGSERTLRILGKRNKQRNVYISPSAAPVVDRWLVVVGTRRGPMFPRVHRTGKISTEAMSPRAVGYVIDRTRTLASLPPTSTHDIRRTHTGDLLDAGVDLSTAQKLLGHASPRTTALYDRRPDRAAQAAADRLVLPAPESLRDEEALPLDTTNRSAT